MMLTLDTNVLVRFLVDSDPSQSAAVQRLWAGNSFFILSSVILETEWVLRSALRQDVKSINMLFSALLHTDGIVLERPDTLRLVLDLHAAGMDFADAMHLCLADETGTFVTFDRDLVRYARLHMPNASVELVEQI